MVGGEEEMSKEEWAGNMKGWLGLIAAFWLTEESAALKESGGAAAATWGEEEPQEEEPLWNVASRLTARCVKGISK